MAVAGWRVVRYADDFVVLTAGEADAKRALRDGKRLLRGRGLALNRDKTHIVAPGESLRFLGRTLVAGSGSVVSVPAPEGT
jgi:RNA-directed DNA polymerase